MEKKELILKAVIEKNQDGFYSIYIPEIAGLFGTGETEDEAKESLNEAIDMALEYIAETGEAGDYASLQGKYTLEYVYDLSGFFKTFDFFDTTALANYIGINASLLRRYKAGITKASPSQKIKIANGIYGVAKKLSVAKF